MTTDLNIDAGFSKDSNYVNFCIVILDLAAKQFIHEQDA